MVKNFGNKIGKFFPGNFLAQGRGKNGEEHRLKTLFGKESVQKRTSTNCQEKGQSFPSRSSTKCCCCFVTIKLLTRCCDRVCGHWPNLTYIPPHQYQSDSTPRSSKLRESDSAREHEDTRGGRELENYFHRQTPVKREKLEMIKFNEGMESY